MKKYTKLHYTLYTKKPQKCKFLKASEPKVLIVLGNQRFPILSKIRRIFDMAKKTKEKIRVVNLYITPSALTSIFKRLRGDKSDFDFSGLTDLRQLLSNEKAKILNTIKTQAPDSIYKLARILKRDFKAVREDLKLLERFGFIELKQGAKGKRKKLKPIIAIDNLQINIGFQ